MWNFDAYSSNPPSTTLRAYGLVLSLIFCPKTAVCNNGTGFCLGVSLGYTKRHMKSLTHLTEPQGKIKNREYAKLLP